ncbi:hypothetical protein BMF94_1419 [Rhodotorula taiwanensis]|uniref:Uncharacterized protein n=1 Tax=Rhodotorula taiwanensis TaxID=741276 RepID=A0A2S5BFH7_9BASI|nr:hypothetical protein BMF94_1419 [Rhodotorula taiwanensis]
MMDRAERRSTLISLSTATRTRAMAESPKDALQLLLPLDDFVPVRVSTHSEMTPLIRFCLEQLVQHGENRRAVVLHTLPVSTSSDSAATSGSSARPNATFNAKQVEAAIAAIPKLVSVLEIIKREYPAAVQAALTSASATSSSRPVRKPRRSTAGLHQYTKLTTYETAFDYHAEVPIAEQETNRDLEAVRQELVQLEWLTGSAGKAKRCGFSQQEATAESFVKLTRERSVPVRPRQRHSPCMLAVLSSEPLAVLTKSSDFAYQPPTPLAKSSKKRLRSQPASSVPATAASQLGPQTSTPLPAQDSGADSTGAVAAGSVPAPHPSAQAGTDALGSRMDAAPAEKRRKPTRRKMRRKKPEQVAVRGMHAAPAPSITGEAASAMDIST